MNATRAIAGQGVLINASNLHVGGGVAVASSVIAALADMPDVAGSITVLASSEVSQNLALMGVKLEAFKRTIQFDVHGLRDVIRKKPVRLRHYDAVFTVFGPLYSPVLGAKSVMGFAQPWVAYPRNSAYMELSTQDRLKTRLKYRVVAGFFSTADVLIVEHESVRVALKRRRLFRNMQIRVVPNVVDALHFDESHWSRVTLPPRSADLRLGVVSRNYPHKNLRILPDVKRALWDGHGIEAEFFVTMTDAEFDSCSMDFRESIANVGELDLAESPSLTSQLDGVVFPTLLECYSATPIEALAVRTPLFASDRPFIRETVGSHASYFDPLDPVSVADSIAEYFSMPSLLRARRAEAGYQHVAARDYSSRDRAEALMRIIGQTVEGRAVTDASDSMTG